MRELGDPNDSIAPKCPGHVPAVSGPDSIDVIGQESDETRPHVSANQEGWPVLSLFSGAGGLDLGFKRVGFHPMLAIDINPIAVETYQNNNPGTTAVPMDLSITPPSDIANL